MVAVRPGDTFRSLEGRSRRRSSLVEAVGTEGTVSGRDQRDGESSGSSRGSLRSARRVDAAVRTTGRKREERSMQGSSAAGRRMQVDNSPVASAAAAVGSSPAGILRRTEGCSPHHAGSDKGPT